MRTPILHAETSDPLLVAMRQAGIVARMMQGRIVNEGKDDTTALPNDDDELRARRAAKTAVDEIVQELLLDTLHSVVDPMQTGLDAEEDTAAVDVFCKRGEAASTIVIDPIDGTYDYVNGKDTYSICVGMCGRGRVLSCAVYFPARQSVYMLPEGGVPILYDVSAKTFEPLLSPDSPSKVVYKNGRVPMKIVAKLEAAGFTVKDDSQEGVWNALLSCLDGTAAGYVCHTRNVRDIFLGPIIASLPEGFGLDWEGSVLQWPDGGRIDRALFGATSVFKDEIIACLGDN